MNKKRGLKSRGSSASAHYILVNKHIVNGGHWHKRDRGVKRRCSFIPSLSILSTASLTRRMTVTMEAGHNADREKRKKRRNNVSAFMNRIRFHVLGVTEMSWRMCVVCVAR